MQNPEIRSDAGYYPNNYEEDSLPLFVMQLWQGVLRFRWLVLAIIGAALLIGLIFTLLATPLYTASTRLDITPTEDRVTNVESVENEDAFIRTQEYYQTKYGLLASSAIAQRVVNALDLVEDPFVRENVIGLDEGDETVILSTGEQAAARRRIAGYLLQNISVEPVSRSALVDVTFTSPDPSFSAKIANEWARQFIQADIDRRFSSTTEARTFLEGQLAELRDKLEESERQLVDYANAQNITPLSTSTDGEGTTSARTVSQTQLEALVVALSQATADRIAAESAARYGDGMSSTSTVPIELADLRAQRGQAAAEYAAMMNRFGPEYPPAKDLRSRIAALDDAIVREEASLRSSRQTNGLASSQSAYREAVAREERLRSQVQQLQGELTGEREASIQYNIYQRDVDTNRELYNGLLQRYKEIGVSGVGSSNIAIVDAAETPRSPSSPNLMVNLLIAAVLGVGLAGLTVIMLTQLDQTIKSAEQARREFGYPVLGVIPNTDKATLIEDLQNPKAPVSEAYQSLSSQLTFLTDHGIPNSVAFTSSRASEGKSATAHALALILARQGKKIALIDSDMRSPSISDQFDLTNDKGLSNYLTGTDDWRSLMIETGTNMPDVMMTGPEPPNSPELLVGDRFRNMIEQMGQHYDHVLIDSPPVLGLADAPLIAGSVEGIIYAIESNAVKINGIRRCLERLDMAHANVFGVIVTKVDNRTGSGYGYGYGYGYGESGSGFSYGKS